MPKELWAHRDGRQARHAPGYYSDRRSKLITLTPPKQSGRGRPMMGCERTDLPLVCPLFLRDSPSVQPLVAGPNSNSATTTHRSSRPGVQPLRGWCLIQQGSPHAPGRKSRHGHPWVGAVLRRPHQRNTRLTADVDGTPVTHAEQRLCATCWLTV
jgi:hypothetical protein